MLAAPTIRSRAAALAFACCCCTTLAAQTAKVSAPPQREAAAEAYRSGARAVDRQDFAAAQQAFDRAIALDPGQPDYVAARDLTRQHRIGDLLHSAAAARMTGDARRADALLAEAHGLDPKDEAVQQHLAPAASSAPPTARIVRSEAPDFAPSIQLLPGNAVEDLHLRGDVRQVVLEAAGRFGIKAVMDDSVEAQQLRFDLEKVTYAQSVPTLLRLARLIAVPLDSHTILVAKDTQENRQRLERQVEETLYIPAATPEQLNELANIVKNIFDVRQVVVSPTNGTLTLRAPDGTLKAANYTLADLVDGGSEVSLEVKLVSVDKVRNRNTGLQTPSSAGVFSLLQVAQSIVTANQALLQQAIASGAIVPTGDPNRDLLAAAIFLVLSGVATDARLTNLLAYFGGGLTLFGVNLGSGAGANLRLNESDSRALDDLTVRIGDRQTTTLRVGSKYPITTSTYSVGSGLANSNATINGQSVSALLNQYLGQAGSVTTPIIAYEDLGLTLKTTPTVVKSGLVSLHVELKLESLTGVSANNIPLLTSRVFSSDIVVEEGTTAVMLSDMSSSESSSVSGIPGLGSLPGFRTVAANTVVERDTTELVLMLTPHLVRRRSGELRSRPYVFNGAAAEDN